MNVQLQDYDIIIISETWLPTEITDGEIGLPDYNIFRCDRKYESKVLERGGGVMIAVEKSIKCHVLDSSNTNGFESLFVKLWFCSKSILLNVTYIPPAGSTNAYHMLAKFFDSVFNNNKNVKFILLFGDFNLPLVEWTRSKTNKLYLEPQNLNPQANELIDVTTLHSLQQINYIKNYKNRSL